MGRPFKYEAKLVSENMTIAFDDILGQSVTVALDQGDGEQRYFNGIVSDFHQTEPMDRMNCYIATIRPWIWFLSQTYDCRIFQNMTVPDIIKQIFRDNNFTDFEEKTSGSYRTWDYCVQYRETSLDFVTRLMEQEGMYYYFKHEDGVHTLVLSDGSTSHSPLAAPYDEIAYYPQQSDRREEHFFDFHLERRVTTGTYTHTDYDFEKPSADLTSVSAQAGSHDLASFEQYDYPGEYVVTGDGEAYSKIRIEETFRDREHVLGTANACGLATGFKFTLTNHHRDDQNREYAIVNGSFQLSNYGELFQASIEAVPADQQFRLESLTPLPYIRGPQTAVVVGPSGEEIWTDKYGRVKVQFHWDREGKMDQDSSCWVRVSHAWAGKTWGAIYTPRIGQEVIVEHLEGDPDKPIITGRVYNGEQMPPYKLPDNATMSTLKSNSSKGGAGFNEIRFEDLKDEEQFWIHGQKDMDIRVLNDRRETIMNDRHLVVENDKFEHIKHDRHEHVENDHYEQIINDRHLMVAANENKEIVEMQSLVVGGDVSEDFGANHSHVVKDDLYINAENICIEGNTNITLMVGGTYIAIEAGGIKMETTGDIELVATGSISSESTSTTDIKATAPLTLESSATADLKSTATTVKGDGMVTIKGGVVMIN
ncbi:MAG: type VI secretion system tip protein VgrG, partial [Planctomycetales bacterium]